MAMTRFVIVLTAVALYPAVAFAYIDPGTGSVLIQGIIAAVAALGVSLKLYWHRIVGLFRRSSKKAISEHESHSIRARDITSEVDQGPRS